MYYANCEWYVDIGEHYKPLCERQSLRPAKCSECPVYIRSIEDENAKLRELVKTMRGDMREMLDTIDKSWDTWVFCHYYGECLDVAESIMRELGIEVGK